LSRHSTALLNCHATSMTISLLIESNLISGCLHAALLSISRQTINGCFITGLNRRTNVPPLRLFSPYRRRIISIGLLILIRLIFRCVLMKGIRMLFWLSSSRLCFCTCL